MSPIKFENRPNWYQKNDIPKKEIRKVLSQLFEDKKFHVKQYSIVLFTDVELIELNRNFLNHNYHTDIITFNYAEEANTINGEAYLSYETISKNAETFGCSTLQEFTRVAIHGALHLCGYQDKSSKDQKIMRAEEEKYLCVFSSYQLK
jgi:probable rRNA maturation factor